jgi:plastocyanin
MRRSSSTGRLARAGAAFDHTFSDQAGAFSVGVDAGKSSQLTLPKAGTYTVICKIHDGMQGTLTVS